MFRPEQIKHHFYRIKRLKRDLHEISIPVTHGTVPETRKLQSLQFPALPTLRTDKSGILVHIIQQIELLAFIIMQAAYKIHRIKVSSTRKNIPRTLLRHIYLHALENLKIRRAVATSDNERTAARLALIPH